MIKQTKKRIFGFLSLLFAAALLLCACGSFIVIHDTPLSEEAGTDGETDLPTGSDSTSDETEALPSNPTTAGETALGALRDADFLGKSFIIAAVETTAPHGDVLDEAETTSLVLDEAREAYLRMVKEKYNVDLLLFSYEKDDLYEQISIAYNADMSGGADFFMLPAAEVGRYQANGLLYNLRSLPFTDYEKDYYDKDAMAQFSAGHGIYAAVGSYTFSPENYYGVFFNKTLSSTLGLDSHYETVSLGSWTWEALAANAATAASFTDSEGDLTYKGGSFATLEEETREAVVLASSGLHAITAGLDTVPTVTADAEAFETLVSVIGKVFTDNKWSRGEEADFLAGEALYHIDDLSHIKEWSNSEVNWGILPLPKTEAGAAAYSSYMGDSPVMCVSSILGAPEATGTLLEALFAAASDDKTEYYLDEALSYYVRDGESVTMLSMICNSPYYDFAHAFASGYGQMSNVSVYGLHYAAESNTSFQRMFDRYKSAAENELALAFKIN